MKKILIALSLALLLTLSLGSAVFAADPTTEVDISWDGNGWVAGDVTVGSGWDGPGTSFATSAFSTDGTGLSGAYSVSTQGKTTYDAWGDKAPTTTSTISALVANGGFVKFWSDRTGITPYDENQHYGPAGQSIYSEVISTGTASLSSISLSTYASLSTSNTWMDASGIYSVFSGFASGTGNVASLLATGSGTADIDMGHSSARSAIAFGWGSGCYTNADAIFTGFGTFGITAIGSNSIATPIANASGTVVAGGWTGFGDGTPGSVSLTTIMNFLGGASVGNYSMAVK